MSTPTLEWTFLTPILPPLQRGILAPSRPAGAPEQAPSAAPPAGEADVSQALVEALGQALAEVLCGRRPTTQLSRWVAGPSLGRLTAAVRLNGWRKVTVSTTRASRHDGGDIWGRVRFDCDGRPLTATLWLRQVSQRWRCLQAELLLPGAHLRSGG